MNINHQPREHERMAHALDGNSVHNKDINECISYKNSDVVLRMSSQRSSSNIFEEYLL